MLSRLWEGKTIPVPRPPTAIVHTAVLMDHTAATRASRSTAGAAAPSASGGACQSGVQAGAGDRSMNPLVRLGHLQGQTVKFPRRAPPSCASVGNSILSEPACSSRGSPACNIIMSKFSLCPSTDRWRAFRLDFSDPNHLCHSCSTTYSYHGIRN